LSPDNKYLQKWNFVNRPRCTFKFIPADEIFGGNFVVLTFGMDLLGNPFPASLFSYLSQHCGQRHEQQHSHLCTEFKISYKFWFRKWQIIICYLWPVLRHPCRLSRHALNSWQENKREKKYLLISTTRTYLYCMIFLKPYFKLFLRYHADFVMTRTHCQIFLCYCLGFIVELLLNYHWIITELLLNYYWIITEFLLNYYWSITEFLLNYYWSITELLLNYYWIVTELLQNNYWIITEFLQNYYWIITEVLINFYWIITEVLLNFY